MRLNADTCQRCALSVSVSVHDQTKILFVGLVLIHTITFDQVCEHCTIAKMKPGAPTNSSGNGYINVQVMVEMGERSSVNGRASSCATQQAQVVYRESGVREELD